MPRVMQQHSLAQTQFHMRTHVARRYCTTQPRTLLDTPPAVRPMAAPPPVQRRALEIHSVFDPMCPWCYFGLRRLRAFLSHSGAEVTVRTVPYVFDPDTPMPPLPWTEYVKLRYPDRAESIFSVKLPMTKQVAASLGIKLCEYERRPISPTVDALRLFFAARAIQEPRERTQLELDLAESLLSAAFTLGLDTSDHRVLLQCATDAGMSHAAAVQALSSPDSEEWVLSETRRAKTELRISSVPSYTLIDGATGRALALTGSEVDWNAALNAL